MHRLFFLFFLFFLPNKDTEEINWDESRPLEWNDFKAPPDHSSDAAAITASGISFTYSINKSSIHGMNFTTKVEAQFYPEQSWFKKEAVNSHTLDHEQLHFDITELSVRKFRKTLSLIKPSEDLISVLQKEETRANEELAKMQNQYDLESNYSLNKSIQKKWLIFVKSELKTLSQYKSKL